MLQSQLFTKTQKEAPKDEVAVNAQLLLRGGFIHKEMAGVYASLPLGMRTINKLLAIIREEMNAVGGLEVHLTALQDRNVWEQSGRWSEEVVDNWFKSVLKDGREVGLAFTHEEPLTRLLTHHVSSYRDLPANVYQIQTKFRNELRARSGIMRGREFLMKDLYSFSRNEAEHDAIYERMKEAYTNIFNRVGIGEKTFITYASGGSFSEFSHEFQTLSDAGEDTIYLNTSTGLAINKEIYSKDVLRRLNASESEFVETTSIEVGNIFSLGTRFSKPLNLVFKDEDGAEKPVIMGSYGIGVGRLMGTIVELYHDERGIIWPESVAPFQAHLVELKSNDEKVRTAAQEVYKVLTDKGIEVLYDERDLEAGEKFADADLIGIPYRLVISDKTLAEEKVEIKRRDKKESELKGIEEVIKVLV